MIALVNSTSNSGSGSSTTIDATAANHTTGNLLVVIARNGGTTGATHSITDTAGNTYIQLNTTLANNGLGNASFWYAKNITGNASNVVRCTYSTGCTFRGIIVVQYSGLDTTAPLDANPTPINTNANHAGETSNTFSTTQADEVIIAAAAYDNGSALAGLIGGTASLIELDIPAYCCLEDLIVSSTQSSITAALSSTGLGDWMFFQASFKGAAAAAPTRGFMTTNRGFMG